jgi:hypothetical protein
MGISNPFSREDIKPRTTTGRPSPSPELPLPVAAGQVAKEYVDEAAKLPGQAAGHVLPLLSYFDRPRNAIATGLSNVIDNDPATGFLEGAYQGLRGQRETSYGDLVNIPAGTSQDDWPTWIANNAVRLGLDTVGDPLLVLGKLGKLAKVQKMLAPAKALSTAGKERLAGTSLGKAFMHRAPGPRGEAFEQALTVAKRRATEGKLSAREAYQRYADALDKDADLGEIREAWEKYHGTVPPEVAEALKAQHAQSQGLVRDIDRLSATLGRRPIGEVSEVDVRYVPRERTERGERALAEMYSKSGHKQTISPESFRGRSLVALKDDMTGKPLLREDGSPVIVQESWLTKADSGKYLWEGQPVKVSQASLRDVQTGIPNLKQSFVDDPGISYLADATKKFNQKALLEFFQEIQGRGLLNKIGRADKVPAGLRRVDIPGMENYVAPKFIANRLENEAHRMLDPSTSLGAVGDALKYFNTQNKFGRGLNKVTKNWKSNLLGLQPDYHAGNYLSNLSMMYGAGEVAPWNIPGRLKKARDVRLSKEGEVIQGIPNATLHEEFAKRNLSESGWSGTEHADDVQQAVKGQGFVREKFGRIPGAIADKWGRANQWGFRQGQKYEGDAKIGVALDWLKKNAPDFATRSADEQARLLDAAAEKAQYALIDYTAATPFEEQLGSVVPFYKWTRGLLGQTAQEAVKRPERLANLGRFYDTMFQPLSEDDKAIAPPYIRDNAAISGVLGYQLPTKRENPGMGLIGRFLPHTTAQQFMPDLSGHGMETVGRPLEQLWSSVNPYIKAPFELAINHNYFKDRPIDEIASRFGENIVNPAIGEPYQEGWGKTLGARLPAAYEYLINSSPVTRYVQKANQIGNTLGLWEDAYKAPLAGGELAAYLTTGAKLYPYDRDRWGTRLKYKGKNQLSAAKQQLNIAESRGDPAAIQHAQSVVDMLEQRRESNLARFEGGS